METRKSRVHTFQGQDLAEPVVEHLCRDDRAADDRVERLVRLELERSRDPLGFTDEDRTPRIVRLVNDTMRVWNFGLVHTATQEGHDWRVGWQPKASKEAGAFEMLAFHDALLLKQQGLLHRIRQCSRPGCQEWFFAKFDHQNYHSEECRIAVISGDEQRKEKRKQYMRDLRAKKKLKKFRASKRSSKKGGR